MMNGEKNAVAGICFYAPRGGKPIGHATLFLAFENKQGLTESVSIDYDGYARPVIQSGAEERPADDLLLFPVTNEQAETALSYYRQIEKQGYGPYYFSQDLGVDFKMAARGKRSANCLMTILNILEDKAYIDIAPLRKIMSHNHAPHKAADAIRAYAAENKNHFDEGVIQLEDRSITASSFKTPYAKRDAKLLSGLSGAYSFAEILSGAYMNAVTEQFDGRLYDNIADAETFTQNPVERQFSFYRDQFWTAAHAFGAYNRVWQKAFAPLVPV